jgi:hypothetical protein
VPAEFRVEINDREVKRLMRDAPRVFNAEFNRSFARAAGAFYKKFAKERLKKGGIQVRRRLAKKASGGGVSVPAKARALGFRGALLGRGELHRKAALMSNSNPVAVIHETGGTIRPRRGNFLFVRVKSVAALRRAGVKVKRGARPKVIKVRQVTIKPRLGFFSTWRAFLPELRQRLATSLKAASDRAVARAKRGTR